MYLLLYLLAGFGFGFVTFELFYSSPLFGSLLGALAGWLLYLNRRVGQLETQLQQFKMRQALEQVPLAANSPSQSTAPPEQLTLPVSIATEPDVPLPESDYDLPPLATESLPPQATVTKEPNFLEQGLLTAKQWLFGGNIFVRLGVMLVFFGVVFLLRYSLEHNLIPIELRLAGSAAGALALLATGWQLRKRAGAYGLVLQAGGVGILYLTVFAAFSLYHVIPSLAAFAFMVMIVTLAVALALLQNSFSFAAFATIGGFLAPLLTSSGSNNYIGLFSFYALLNAGIVTIAWFKSWRLLNLIGFVFTFVIASVWGWFSYRPENFATVEPFLILFFLFYVLIAILFALRTPVNFKDKVDSTLVFGVPLVGFCMQIALVRNFEYGIAISSLVLGAFYLVLSVGLWKRFGKAQQLLTETFLSLGVIFTTLAIPFAVDGALTSAAWALEGAGIVWISIRQQQFLRRLFGVFLQYAALVYWLADIGLRNFWFYQENTAFFNGFFIAMVLITGAMLLSSYLLAPDFASKQGMEKPLPLVLLLSAIVVQWLSFNVEVLLRVDSGNTMMVAHVVYLGLWVGLLLGVARLTVWTERRFLLLVPVVTLVVATLTAGAQSLTSDVFHSNDLYRWASLMALFGASYTLLYRYEAKALFSSWLKVLHPIVAWALVVALHNEVVGLAATYFDEKTGWFIASFAVAGLAYLAVSLLPTTKRFWPFTTQFNTLFYSVSLPLAALLGFWLLIAGFSEGLSSPLPWLPVLNPLDLSALLLGVFLVKLYYQFKHTGVLSWAAVVRYSGVALGFYWLNSIILHILHYWVGLAWDERLIAQPTTQTMLAIVWALSGITLAWRGHQKVNRPLWTAGVVLLGIVVLKLFLIDFASSGTLARVISFISVGVLLLFIGYLAPLPPAQVKQVAHHA